jgi:glycosyltransferase involved in cell wall biosynthesis
VHRSAAVLSLDTPAIDLAPLSPEPLALFIGRWLPYSETFVRQQLAHQRLFRAHVFARGRCKDGLRVPYPDLSVLSEVAAAQLFWTGRSSAFEQAIETLAPRLVHAHFGLNGVLALPFARALGVPLVVSFHGHDVPGLFASRRHTPRYARYQRLASAMFEYASRLICASDELAHVLVSQAGAPAHKIEVLHLGVELPTIPAPETSREQDVFRVLMVGRMVEKKGMEFGIEAFARLRARRPDARLTIVGDGPLRRRLERKVRTLALQTSIVFTGALSADRVRREMLAVDVLMAPCVVARDGDRESGTLVVKEAGALGLPVVASWHGGIPEIVVDGETGLLAGEREVPALAAALARLASDRALCTALGSAARLRIARRFEARAQNHALEALYLRVLGSA